MRVAIVDDHPAVRVGLETALRSQSGITPVGSADGEFSLEPLLYQTRPDVLLLDYHLPGTDGLTLCQSIKSGVLAPAVLLYSAFADASLVLPAIVAGADGVVHKGAPPAELFEGVRAVARGDAALPPVSPASLQAAAETLNPDDVPILGMLIDRTPHDEIASTLRIDRSELSGRLARMLRRLTAEVSQTAGSGDIAPGARRRVDVWPGGA